MQPLQELRKLQSKPSWLAGLLTGSAIVLQATVAQADIIPSPAFAPANVTQGGRSQLSITLNNDALTAVTGLGFTNTLPPGMRLSPTPAVSNTCGGTPATLPLSTTLGIAGGTIPARVGSVAGQCKIVVEVIGIGGGNQVFDLAAGAISGDGGASNSQGAKATLQVAGLNKVGTVITFGPTLIPSTSSSTMTVKFTNTNRVPLTAAQFASLLPTGLKIKGTTFTSNTCGGALTIDPPPTGFKLTGGTIPAGGCEFSWSIEGELPPTDSQGEFTYSFADGILETAEFVSNNAGSDKLKIQQGLRVQQSLSRGSAVGGSADEGGTLQVFTGETATLKLILSNAGGALSNVNLAQTLPTGLVIANNVTSTTCTGMTITANPGDNNFSFTAGTIPAATATALQTCELTVNVTAADAGKYKNVIAVNAIANAQNSLNLNASDVTLDVVDIVGTGGNGIGVAIGFQGNMNSAFYDANQISAGNSARMNISLDNGTGIPLTGVGFGAAGIKLPTGVRLANVPNPTTNCPSGTATVAGTDTVLMSGSTLDRRQKCVVSVSVVSDTAGPYTANAIVGTFISNQSRSNNAAAGTLQVLDYINMEQYFDPTVVAASAAGNRAKMRLKLTNAAFAASAQTRLRFRLAGGLKFAGGVLINTCNGALNLAAEGDIFDLSNATIPAGTGQGLADDGSCEIEYDVIAAGTPGSITNTIPANVLENGAGQKNATPVLAKLNLADVAIAVNQEVLNVTPGDPNNGTPIVTGGEPAKLTVTLKNDSGITLTNIGYLNNLPTGAVIYAIPAANPDTCSGAVINAVPNDNKYSVSGISLNSNQSCKLNLQVTNLVPGNTINTIPIKAVTSLQGGSNPELSDVTLTTLANATVSKTFTPPTIAAGQTTKLTLNLVNANNIALTNVSLPDVFPAGMVVANTPNVSNTCGGTINAAAGAEQASLVGGTMAKNSICTFTVDVTALTAQPYTNVIPIGALQTAEQYTNSRRIEAILDVTGTTIVRPGLRLVKRITDIDNNPINGLFNFAPATGRDDDNAAKWPGPIDPTAGISPFLKGAYVGSQIAQQGNVKVGSVIEYTGYFLSDGNGVAKNAQLCDYLPANTEYIAASLTATLANGDGLTGQYLPVGSTFPTACKGTNNGSGAVVVNVGNLAPATGAGTPTTSYGSFKFKLKVK
jgi:uncharacterized repeat protein (TIGR01451 family)